MNNSNSVEKAGIYIHIPFCTVKCRYCDFYSITNRERDIPEFINTIISEIQLVSKTFNHRWVFDTIFIGGGTPSLLKPEWINKILQVLCDNFEISNGVEITMETNPGEAPPEFLNGFRKAGVNRLSIGFQSFQPELLQFLDRIHSPEDCFTTFNNARISGFENINTDLIFNIPGQSIQRWQQDIQSIIELHPEHISMYSLTLEPGTPLAKQVQSGIVTMPDESNDHTMYDWALNILPEKGYHQYEISNFSKKKKQCRHNLHYWNLDPYLGFGPSAHGYDGKIRYWNSRSLDTYIQQLQKDVLPIDGQELLSETDKFNELIFNGLRLNTGISIESLKELFPAENFDDYLDKYLNTWNQLRNDSGILSLNSEGIFLADSITSDMFIH